MKIVLVHGDNKPKVLERTRLIVEGVRKKGWKIERLDKNAKLSEAFTSNTLLPESKLCILEGVGNLNKESVEWITAYGGDIDGSLLIIHSGDAPKRPLQPIKKLIKEEYFPLPKILFKYLDSLKPGRASDLLKTLHKIYETESPELVIAMMGRHFRDLLWAKMDAKSMDYPEWRVLKLTAQADVFSKSNLTRLISNLAEADYDAKTGSRDIITSLDIILMRELS